MERSRALLKDLLILTKDGEWGNGEPSDSAEPMLTIRGTDFAAVRSGEIGRVPLRYIKTEIARRKRLEPGDILIETAGGTADQPTGRTLLLRPSLFEHAEHPVTCASFARFLRVDRERTLPEYLFWYLQNLYRNGQMHEYHLQHTGVARFQYTLFASETEVLLPSLHEQEGITAILEHLDDKIELNRRMNQTLESMARAIFRSWFVDFDPVVAKAASRQPFGMSLDVAALFPDSFANSVLTPIPSGWREAGVTDLGRFVNGKNFTKNATGSGRLVIRIAELNSGLSASSVFSQVDAAPEYTAYPGDILFAWSGSLDVYRWHRAEALINQHIFKVIPQGLPAWFVYYHLKNAMPFFQGVAADKATTMGHVKRSHLSEWPLAIPDPGLLEAANGVIESLYLGIHLNERTNFTLAALRDALLPKLMSGELRVRDAEKLAGIHV